MNKKIYTTPKLTNHGNVEVLTQGSRDGESLDQSFPAGTPRGNLRFS
jgi:hypothetical protein